ncbi:hypothetical protein OKW34_000142 [Paraburkholderia youngii]|uniref:nuclease-related domain-containing protein n=1 Tax=Paraburkholderia youngii TaxID=2782701 RepID=UPI003D240060
MANRVARKKRPSFGDLFRRKPTDRNLALGDAPGADFPTAEIDHLAVTPFGIFVFETKNWSGYISPASVPGFLTRTDRDGKAEDRRSPLEQNRTKVAFFRSRLPSLWPVAGAGLLVSDDAHLSPALHSDLLSLGDLPHWLRARRDSYSGMPPVEVTKATTGIALLIDTSCAAMSAHRARVAM